MAKASKQKRQSNANDEINDSRFTAAATRPQFHKAKRSSYNAPTNTNKGNNTNSNDNDKGNSNDDASGVLQSSGLGASLTEAIQSDDRFSAALLNSDKFGCVPSRDKYGRKTKKKKDRRQKDDEKEESGDEESESEEIMNDENAKKDKKKGANDEVEQDNSMEARIAYLNALSRGDISESSDSESSDDDDDSDKDDDDSSTSSTDIRGKSGIFDPAHDDDDDDEIDLTEEPSPYLCILNLNWEHTRAVDVYAMLHSFCPPGTLKGVEVYPSDFGKERMEREKVEGPTGLWKKERVDKDGGDDVDSEDNELDDGDGNDDNSSKSDNDNDEEYDKHSEEEESIEEEEDDASDDESQSDEELTLAEATSKLYSHFPPQSSITKNSQLRTPEEEEEGFDPEKLREYEVSKLRYYFCVATFHSSEAAENVYENVDGMEMEASAAEIDVRVLPQDQYACTIEGRTMRDQCDSLPAKYVPPEDNVTVALRQSRVSCSWERGDADRERKLTRYGMGKDAWEAMAEGDDIKFYLATSDNSSCEEDGSSEDEKDNDEVEEKKKQKGSGMRAMLGLAGSDSEDNEDQSVSDDSSSGSDSDNQENDVKNKNDKKHSKLLPSTESEPESEDEKDEEADDNKQVTFTPGKRNLEKKIRSKLQSNQSDAVDGKGAANKASNNDFDKYLEKQKAKRKERRLAARNKKKDSLEENNNDGDSDDDDGMYGDDPEFGRVQFSDEESTNEENNKADTNAGNNENDDDGGFFLGETSSQSKSANKKKKKQQQRMVEETSIMEGVHDKQAASTKEELELLIAGDDDEEHNKDYDMRGLVKLQKHANKKLKGKRKRQLETLSANVSGQDFQIDTTDDRFAALLEGKDGRFGIDRTNSSYKETGAMRALLAEQSKRRTKNRGRGGGSNNSEGGGVVDGISKKEKKMNEQNRGDSGWVENSSGAMQLSSLVKSLQRKVSKNIDGSKRKKSKVVR